MKKHYVIADTDKHPWVLGLNLRTQQEAERAVAWQKVDQGALDAYTICTFDRLHNEGAIFKDANGAEHLVADRGPYTVKAWQHFLTIL